MRGMGKVQPLTHHFKMLFSKRKVNLLRDIHMSLVKVRSNGQVTLPSSLRKRAKLNMGDLLEAKLEKGKITLRPASLIGHHIAESQEQIKKGSSTGHSIPPKR